MIAGDGIVASLGSRVFFLVGLATTLITALLVWWKHLHFRDRGVDSDDVLTAVFLSVVTVVIASGWVSVILASFGVFSIGLVGAIIMVLSAVVGVLTKPLPVVVGAVTVRFSTAVLVFLVALCSLVYFRPHEYVLGGSDAGTYVNIAAALARTGDFVIRDDFQTVLSEHADAALRKQPEVWRTRYLQFVGWYVDDSDPARIVPQFFPYHPSLLAVGASLGGVMGALMVTPIWGVLGIVAVYLLSLRLFDAWVATISAVLIAVTPTLIYFSRYPTTEPLTLLLVAASLLALQVLWEGGREVPPAWGVFGGAALGSAFLTRIDLPVVLVIVLAFVFVRRIRGQWSGAFTGFFVTLILFTLHAALSAFAISYPYTWNTYSSVLLRLRADLGQVGIAFGGVLLVIAALAIWTSRRWLPWAKCELRQRERVIRIAVALALCGLSLYAYFVRPSVSSIPYVTSWPLGDQTPVLNSQNWRMMGWYLTPLGIALATLGVSAMICRESTQKIGLFLAVGLITTLQYQYDAFNMSYHIYVMRRYLPVVIPALVIYVSYAISALLGTQQSRRLRLLGVALLTAMVGGLIYQSRYVVRLRDFRGLADQLSDLNSALAPNALVIFAEPSDSAEADRFGVPLRFMFDHPVATLRGVGTGAVSALEAMLAYANDRALPVELLAANPIPETVRDALNLVPQASLWIDTEVMESTYFTYPSHVQKAGWAFDIYQVEGLATGAAAPAGVTTSIDVGGIDSHYLVDGFHQKERDVEQHTLRWTGGRASVRFPTVVARVTVSLRATIPVIDGYHPAEVLISLDGSEVGTFVPSPGQWMTFELVGIAQPLEGYSTLVISTTPFTPADLRLNQDNRQLGVMLDWIRVSSTG